MRDLIYNLFKINFSYNPTVHSKKKTIYYTMEIAQEDLKLFKKELWVINTNNRMLVFLDETVCQSIANVRRALYSLNTKKIFNFY